MQFSFIILQIPIIVVHSLMLIFTDEFSVREISGAKEMVPKYSHRFLQVNNILLILIYKLGVETMSIINVIFRICSQGSVLVDYFVELADLKEKVNTQQLKVIFHDSLRTFNFDNPMEATPKGPMKLGKFTIDPKSTDFVGKFTIKYANHQRSYVQMN